MKRLFIILLLVSVFCSALLFNHVFAEEQPLIRGTISPAYQQTAGPSYEALDRYTDMTAFRAYLDANLQVCREQIDISAYGIPSDQVEALAFYIYKDIPEAFHVTSISYSAYPDRIASLYFSYSLSKTEYDAVLKQCRDVAAEMTRGLDDSGLTQAEKALILHDRLAVHNEYDTSLKAPYTHEMVGALVNRTSVCEGYAMAYSYLLDQVGIRNYYVTSSALNHGWNMVYIDGVPYHVDVTWDDPLNDRLGYVSHNNFLRSTAGMISTGHHDRNGAYDYGNVAQDTRYDGAYWQNSRTAFQVLNGKLYYIDSSYETKLMEAVGGENRVLADISCGYETSMGYWGSGYQMLSSDGQDLLYSKANAIYRYCTETNTAQVVWTPEMSLDFSIFGFAYEQGSLICIPYTSPNFAVDTNHIARMTKAYVPHIHMHDHAYDDACDSACNICGEVRNAPHVFDNAEDLICNGCGYERSAIQKGDLDGQNGVNLDDAIHLLYYVNFPHLYAVNQNVDFDGSGTVDLDDAIYFLYHVNFPALYPLN